MGNLLITMSGGTTQVINATLAGVVAAAQKSSMIDKVFAGVPGLLGVASNNIIELTNLTNEQIGRLKYTPSSGFIGTTRLKFLEKEDFEILEKRFSEYGIDYFLNIGGNGTIKQTMSVGNYFNGKIKVASLPKTVDNDLGDDDFSEVFFTPGYPSCMNYWIHKVHMMNQENQGAFSHDKVLIGQAFGRKTGFITAAARFADLDRDLPLLLLLPEAQKPLNEVLDKIDDLVSKFGRAIVIMSEGYDVGNVGEIKDHSGQVMYGSSQTTAVQLLTNECLKSNIQARSFNPTVDQRSEITFSLEHDISASFNIGQFAIDAFEQSQTNFLASVGSDPGYVLKNRIIPYSDIKDYSRVMPHSWIDDTGFDVSDHYIEYGRAVLADCQRVRLPFPEYENFLHLSELTKGF